jgi:hypothetical protein
MIINQPLIATLCAEFHGAPSMTCLLNFSLFQSKPSLAWINPLTIAGAGPSIMMQCNYASMSLNTLSPSLKDNLCEFHLQLIIQRKLYDVHDAFVYYQTFQLHGYFYTLYFFSLFWGHVFFAFQHNLGFF